MRVQRFEVRVAAGPRGCGLIVMPFDPDAEWGVKAVHHVSGTVNGCRVRLTLEPGESGWAFTMNPARLQHAGIAAALEGNPAAGAFFDTLAQFYRKGYLRYIDATKRRPDLRAARIAEVTGLLASGIKERPRP
jgi:bacteriocin resistance YdeI/OmpD-like protein